MLQENNLEKLGIIVESGTGHLRYASHFTPLKLSCSLIFVRHGETYGNCGQSLNNATIDKKMVKIGVKNHGYRIYQGNVDEEINQLTTLGQQQAEEVALKIEKNFFHQGWEPDAILHSPLSRAKETGIPLIKRNNLWARFHVNNKIREMSFGAWDNRRICDIPPDDSCHLFYKDQNSLVKKSGVNGNNVYQEGENFCEVIVRANQALQEINHLYTRKRVILFSHSMFGAACLILLGKAQKIECDDYLAFDGKRNDGTHYAMPHAQPFILT